jgi:hypothetical protein
LCVQSSSLWHTHSPRRHNMPKPPKSCLRCGTLQTHGSRCEACHAKHETARTARRHRPHYDAAYRKRAKVVRETATVCWLCGGGWRANDPWTADHVIPADPNSPLLAAHKSCNSSRGNRTPAERPQSPLLRANPQPLPIVPTNRTTQHSAT